MDCLEPVFSLGSKKASKKKKKSKKVQVFTFVTSSLAVKCHYLTASCCFRVQLQSLWRDTQTQCWIYPGTSWSGQLCYCSYLNQHLFISIHEAHPYRNINCTLFDLGTCWPVDLQMRRLSYGICLNPNQLQLCGGIQIRYSESFTC